MLDDWGSAVVCQCTKPVNHRNCSLFCVPSSLISRISASSRNICFAWMESRSQYEKVTTCLIFLGVMVWLIDLIWPQCIAQDGSLCKKIPPFPVLLGGRQMLPTAVDANRRHVVNLSLPFTQLRLLCMWASWSYVRPSAVEFPLCYGGWLPIDIGLSVAKVCLFQKLLFFFLCLQEN